MNESKRYAKIVEWSEEDQCYVGSVPGLIYGGCHGTDERAVFDELCGIVEEAIALYLQNGKPLPPSTFSPSQGARMASALERLAASGGPGIDDPLEWQRQSRLNPFSET